MRSLSELTEQLLMENGAADSVSSVLGEALGQSDYALREGAASALLDALPRAGVGARARIVHLLQSAWWPPSQSLVAPAFQATRKVLLRIEEDEAPELRDVPLIWSHLARVDAAIVPAVVEALEDESPAVRQAAAGALGRMGEVASPHVPALIDRLTDPSEHVGGAALESLSALAPLRPDVSLEALRAEVARTEGARRFMAMMALRGLLEDALQRNTPPLPGQGEPDKLEETLVTVLSGPDAAPRLQAASLLGLRWETSPRVETALRRALDDESPDVAATAAVALLRQELATGHAVELLKKQLAADAVEPVEAALTALETMDDATLKKARPVLDAASTIDAPPVKEAVARLRGRLGG